MTLEDETAQKIYRFSWTWWGILFLLCVFSSFLVLVEIKENTRTALLDWKSWGSLLALLGILLSATLRIELTHRELRVRLFKWLSSRSRLTWDSVKSIVEGSFAGWHMFYVMTKDDLFRTGNKCVIYSNWCFKDHRNFLRDVVQRVPPTCHVDQSILDRIGFTHDDIGKLYKSPSVAAES